MSQLIGKGLTRLREHGVLTTLRRGAEYLRLAPRRRAERLDAQRYADWIRKYDTPGATGREEALRREREFKYRPLVSVLMPVYNTPEVFLRRAIESVLAQVYTCWELCVADDASTRAGVRAVLGEFAARDSRIKVLFRPSNGHIAAASNSALSLAAGEFVALLDHDDELHVLALHHVAAELNAHPEASLLYSDEDTMDADGGRTAPHFKPDWSPDLFMSQNFINHLSVYRASTVREAGGFAEGLEGSQDYDLALRVTERIPASHVRHIPRVLYHWRAIPGSISLGAGEKSYATVAAQKALAGHLKRTGRCAEVTALVDNRFRIRYGLPSHAPRVHLVVSAHPKVSADESLEQITSKTSYPDYEITFVSSAAGAGRAASASAAGGVCVRAFERGEGVSEARALNGAARAGGGEVLLFLDGALSPLDRDWLTEMVSHASRAEIGAVGAKLLDGAGAILHAGLLLGVGDPGSARVAGSAFHGVAAEHPRAARFGRPQVVQNFSAIAKSCLMIRRELFEELGGFDEANLPRLFYDVDLCLRLRGLGRRVLFTPFATLRLCSGPSRPYAYYNTPGCAESEYMHRRWGELLRNDPYYNPNLDLRRGNYDLAFPPRVGGFV